MNRDEFQYALDRIDTSFEFDGNWYASTYRDVVPSGLDPAIHFVLVGSRLGRDPGPSFSSKLWQDIRPKQCEMTKPAFFDYLDLKAQARDVRRPNPKGVLMEAARLSESGYHKDALDLARRHLTPDLTYTCDIVRANIDLAAGNETAWLEHLNSYLERFGLSPLHLAGEGSVFERLAAVAAPGTVHGPLVSILMPAWNAESTLQAAANSILGQTWKDLELIIIDDGSTDQTYSTMQGLAASDNRVRLVRSGTNAGPYVAKNIALHHARGSWITGHDADDWAHPQRIEKHMAAIFAHGGVKSSLTELVRIAPNGRFSFIDRVGIASRDGVARRAPITCMFEADFMRTKLGHWDSVRFAADSEMVNRLKALLGDRFIVFDQPSMLSRDVASSLSNDVEHGVDKVHGLSPIRRAYRAAYQAWHSRLDISGDAYIPLRQGSRKFEAPVGMVVPVTDEILDVARRNDRKIVGHSSKVSKSKKSKNAVFLIDIYGNQKIKSEDAFHINDVLGSVNCCYVNCNFDGVDYAQNDKDQNIKSEKNLRLSEIVNRKKFDNERVATTLVHIDYLSNGNVDSDTLISPKFFADFELTLILVIRSPSNAIINQYKNSVINPDGFETRELEQFTDEVIKKGECIYSPIIKNLRSVYGGADIRALYCEPTYGDGEVISLALAEVGIAAPSQLSELQFKNPPTASFEEIEARRRLNIVAWHFPRNIRRLWAANIQEKFTSAIVHNKLRTSALMFAEEIRSEVAILTQNLNKGLVGTFLTGLTDANKPVPIPTEIVEVAELNRESVEHLLNVGVESLFGISTNVAKHDEYRPLLSSSDALMFVEACQRSHCVAFLDVDVMFAEYGSLTRNQLIYVLERELERAAELHREINYRAADGRVLVVPTKSEAELLKLWQTDWFQHPDLIVVSEDQRSFLSERLPALISKEVRVFVLSSADQNKNSKFKIKSEIIQPS